MTQQSIKGPRSPIFKVSRLHTIKHRLLCTSDRLSQSRYLRNTPQRVEANVRVQSWIRTRDTRIKRPRTNVLDSTTTGIDTKKNSWCGQDHLKIRMGVNSRRSFHEHNRQEFTNCGGDSCKYHK